MFRFDNKPGYKIQSMIKQNMLKMQNPGQSFLAYNDQHQWALTWMVVTIFHITTFHATPNQLLE
jgi:hypothetical protein